MALRSRYCRAGRVGRQRGHAAVCPDMRFGQVSNASSGVAVGLHRSVGRTSAGRLRGSLWSFSVGTVVGIRDGADGPGGRPVRAVCHVTCRFVCSDSDRGCSRFLGACYCSYDEAWSRRGHCGGVPWGQSRCGHRPSGLRATNVVTLTSERVGIRADARFCTFIRQSSSAKVQTISRR